MKKFFRNIFTIILLLIILFNLSGCYDAKSIEELAYVVALGVDTTDDNQLEITLQFATSGSDSSSDSSSGSSQSTGTNITSIKCSSISSGLAGINSHISKRVNLSHCQEIIISEKLAYSGISEYLNTFADNIEVRADCSIVISKCTAKDYLQNVKPSLETLTARYYESSLNSNEYTGYTVDVRLADFCSQLKDNYSQAYAILGGVNTSSLENPTKLNGNYTAGNSPIEDKDVIETIGIAVFNGDKLVGELTGLDSICHLIVTNKLQTCTISIPSPFEDIPYIDLNITSNKNTKCSVEEINSTPLINVDVHLTGYVLSHNDSTSIEAHNSVEASEQIKSYAEKYIKSQIENYLYKTSQKYNSDIVGFGRYILKDYLTIDDCNKLNWLDNYKYSFFNVNVNFNLFY